MSLASPTSSFRYRGLSHARSELCAIDSPIPSGATHTRAQDKTDTRRHEYTKRNHHCRVGHYEHCALTRKRREEEENDPTAGAIHVPNHLRE